MIGYLGNSWASCFNIVNIMFLNKINGDGYHPPANRVVGTIAPVYL